MSTRDGAAVRFVRRELRRLDSRTRPLESGSTVRDLVDRLRLLPGASILPRAPLVAVNRRFAAADQVVHARDEIAIIPPVAGG